MSIYKKALIHRALGTFADVVGWVNGRCERIRTSDPFVPNEVRYQAALHTEFLRSANIPEPRAGTKGLSVAPGLLA